MSHSPKRALISGLLHGMSKCVLATAAAASMLLTLGVTTANAAEGAPASTVTKDQLQTLVTESKKIDQNTKTVPTAEALAAALKTADATLAQNTPSAVDLQSAYTSLSDAKAGLLNRGNLTWYWNGSKGSATQEATITDSMNFVTKLWSERTNVTGKIGVKYSTGCTAEGGPSSDYGEGTINFCTQMSRRTALHEISHVLGMYTWGWQWNGPLCYSGRWHGVKTNAMVQKYNGAGTVIGCDTGHGSIWPYGMNYDSELPGAKGSAQQLKMAQQQVDVMFALRQDTMNPNPVITTATVPDGSDRLPSTVKGNAYSQQLKAAPGFIIGSGKSTVTNYAVVGGALPAGLTLSSDGKIAGTATVDPGIYTFDVKVTNKAKKSSTSTLQLAVVDDTLEENGGITVPSGDANAKIQSDSDVSRGKVVKISGGWIGDSFADGVPTKAVASFKDASAFNKNTWTLSADVKLTDAGSDKTPAFVIGTKDQHVGVALGVGKLIGAKTASLTKSVTPGQWAKVVVSYTEADGGNGKVAVSVGGEQVLAPTDLGFKLSEQTGTQAFIGHGFNTNFVQNGTYDAITVEAEDVPITPPAEAVPENLVYYIDAGVRGSATSAEYQKIVEAYAKDGKSLLNDRADRVYTAPAGWGALAGARLKTGADGKNSNGLIATGPILQYRLKLQPGTYELTTGVAGFGSARSMQQTVTGAGVQVKPSSEISVAADGAESGVISFTVSKATTVTYRLTKTGGANPALAWLQVQQLQQ